MLVIARNIACGAAVLARALLDDVYPLWIECAPTSELLSLPGGQTVALDYASSSGGRGTHNEQAKNRADARMELLDLVPSRDHQHDEAENLPASHRALSRGTL